MYTMNRKVSYESKIKNILKNRNVEEINQKYPSYPTILGNNTQTAVSTIVKFGKRPYFLDDDEYFKITMENSIVNVDEKDIKSAIDTRDYTLNGFQRNCLEEANNLYTLPDYLYQFWNNYDFSTPSWLHDIVYGASMTKILRNNFQYHPEANIDTICAHLFEGAFTNKLKICLLRVQLCVFEKFIEVAQLLRNQFVFLKYACMCNKYYPVCVHVIVVMRVSVDIFLKYFEFLKICPLAVELEQLFNYLQNFGVTITSWPEHKHIEVQSIKNDLELFDTINSLCNKVKCNCVTSWHIRFCFSAPELAVHHELILHDKITTFFSKYSSQPNLISLMHHFYVFRTIIPEPQIWFSALTVNGIAKYVNSKMTNISIIPECDKVFSNKNKACLFYGDILKNLPAAAIPLKHDTFIYHAECLNGEKRSNYDNNSFLVVSKDRFIYTTKFKCCSTPVPELIFHATNLRSYNLDSIQMEQYKSFLFWKNKTNKVETKRRRIQD